MRRILIFKNDEVLARVALRCAASTRFAQAVKTVARFAFGDNR